MAAAIVGFCVRRRWPVIAAALLLALAAALYALANFKINTDTEGLLGRDLAWEQRMFAYQKEFPEHQIIAVVEAPTPELAEIASDQLTAALRQRSELFLGVQRPQGGAFMDKSALLYLPKEQIGGVLAGLHRSEPVLAVLAADPSLRGAMQALNMGAEAVRTQQLSPDGLTRPMDLMSGMLEAIFADRFASISWRGPMNADAAGAGMAPAGPSRQFITIDPKLDFAAMQPGQKATSAIRQAVDQLQLEQRYGANVKLTGRVPLNDAQFATLSKSAIPELLGTVVTVLVILWLALRSARIIAAVFITLAIGFALTTAVGLMLVGSFNLISISFAILFVGLGADFGIQYSVRYRGERHEFDDMLMALGSAARKAGGPLALAAAGTAVGFFCFLPTDYRGVAELGEIAGIGMLIAFATTITVLPALLTAFRPPGEKRPMGFRFLAPVDRALARFRLVVVFGTIAAVLAGIPLLPQLRFDVDPIHLQEQSSEAVTTYRALAAVPELGINAANVIVPSADRIPTLVKSIGRVPEVASTHSVLDLIPPDQEPKLAQIRQAAATLRPALNPPSTKPPPSDEERIGWTRQAAAAVQQLATSVSGETGAAAKRLAPLLARLADANPAVRDRAEDALALPLKRDLDRLRNMLKAEPVTLQSLPPDVARDWIAPDGRMRVEILPKGDQNDPAVLRRFAKAVLAITPEAAGTPIQLYESERTVLRAFIEAGVLAIIAIGLILWVALRRLGDVLLTLVPLIIAGLVTLELMVLFGLSLNFANVIALPLLLGVGVAFKIYYIMAWRSGRTNLLQSTLTRAVFFSALTTATAFGSLWLSKEPGMSSMGRLMALALICTLAAAVLFQPALMGPPRQKRRAPRETPVPSRALPAPEPAPSRPKQPEPVE